MVADSAGTRRPGLAHPGRTDLRHHPHRVPALAIPHRLRDLTLTRPPKADAFTYLRSWRAPRLPARADGDDRSSTSLGLTGASALLRSPRIDPCDRGGVRPVRRQ